jgi:methionyl-tRNA synthetase
MSKSRGNFLDPIDFVTAFGSDGARYVALREAAFDRDSDVSWDTFTRRYNADLANDFGNFVNRTVSMAGRYLDGERPAPREATESPLGVAWSAVRDSFVARLERCLLHEALAALWEFVGAGNRFVEAEQPWVIARAVKAGENGAAERLRGVLGDLVEACRLVALAVAPVMPGLAPRVMEQLGYAHAYAEDGNDGPPLLDQLRWGAHADEAGRLAAPVPLFPRLEIEADEVGGAGPG